MQKTSEETIRACPECAELMGHHNPECYHADCDEDDWHEHGCGPDHCMKVVLRRDDINWVDGEKRYGVAILPVELPEGLDTADEDALSAFLEVYFDQEMPDPIERVYAASEVSSFHNARMICRSHRLDILSEI